MNRSQLRAAVKSRLGIPVTGDALLDDATLNDIIQNALTDLSNEYQWPWLLTSGTLTFTNGVAPFPTSPAPIHLRELVINGRRARKATGLGEFLDIAADGSRCVWFDIGQTINLGPVPATAPTSNTLYYLRNEPTLTADSSSPLAPDEYHTVIVARAAYLANVRRNRAEDSQRDLAEYMDGVKKMRDAYPMRTGPRSVRPAGATYWAVWA